MRKIFLYFLLSSALAFPLRAETDAKTAAFLQKLGLYYYCPGREGLKGFTCNATCTLSKQYKKSLEEVGADAAALDALDGQRFTVTVDADGKATAQPLSPVLGAPSGAPRHADVETIRKNLEDAVGNWASQVVKPAFGQIEPGADYKVVTVPGGFTLTVEDAQRTTRLRMNFDSKAKLLDGTATKDGATIAKMTFGYTMLPKGFQLDSLDVQVPKAKMRMILHAYYQAVGGFDLPKRLVTETDLAKLFKKGSTLTFDFSGYQLAP